MRRKIKKPRYLKRKKSPLVALAYSAFGIMIILSIISIISTQSTIAEKNKELQEIQDRIEELEMENTEYKRIFENEDRSAYMEKYATENPELNYGIPNERRFYDVSRN